MHKATISGGFLSILVLCLLLQSRQVWASSICGTNEANAIYCTTFEGMEHGKWERLPGELKQAVLQDGAIWGVNAKDEIFFARDHVHPKWEHVDGSAKEVSVGAKLVCVVNNKDQIFCADRSATMANPAHTGWKKAPDGAKLKFVSVE